MTFHCCWPFFRKTESVPLSVVPKETGGLQSALNKAKQTENKSFSFRAPELLAGVVPKGKTAPIAMDSNIANFPAAYSFGDVAGFLGYPYLSMLATRAEYRAFASSLSTELTREWITINSSETAGDSTKKKVTELTQKIADIGLKGIIQTAAEHDCYFGRAQIFIDIRGHDPRTPLVLSPKTIALGSFKRVTTVEAIWTTPAAYNAIDPRSPEFYNPPIWFMLGKEVHATRLQTVITRPLPDMLKPGFNFGGMSLSQLTEPYVNNWLRTRQSVANLIDNFSVTALKTAMGQILQGDDDGSDLIARAELFTALRSNKGIMLLDKDSEDLVQVNTPLSGLAELQLQAQEQMCSVSHTPALILLGTDPGGLNTSSDGVIRTFYDWIAALQEAHWRKPIDVIIKVLQLSMYGEIDPDINFTFVSLYQMTPKELSEIRLANSTAASNYIDRSVIDPAEQRESLARDPESGYQGLDVDKVISDPNEDEDED